MRQPSRHENEVFQGGPPWAAAAEASVVPARSEVGDASSAAATALESLPLPARLLTWADRKGMVTLEELACIAPRDLLAERHLGRKTIAETRVVLEAKLGCSWEAAARAARGEELPAEDPFASNDWNVLRLALPEALAATSPTEIDLPARVLTYMRNEGLRTIGEIATRSKAELLSAKNLGRSSIPKLVEALHLHVERVDSMRWKVELGLLESWKALLQEADAVRRMVLTRRAGLGGPSETLQSIGETLGVSRERARQLENAVLADLGRERFWLNEVQRRLDGALKDGAIALDELAADPWWASIAARPAALDYFGEQLLGGAMRVVSVDERAHLARCSQAAFDEASDELRKKAAEVSLPAPLATFQGLAEELVPRVGRLLTNVLFERLRERLHIDGDGLDVRRPERSR